MTKASAQLTQERRDEIIQACATLYETMSFRDITIKEIGNATSFTRTSIYNYFHTKEEIFLALLQREYMLWTEDLNAIGERCPTLTREGFAREMALSLEKRERLLKLMSMNHYDMEANSRNTMLITFKKAYGASMEAIDRCLKRYFPQLTAAHRQTFLYAFLPFVYGIYPYTIVTEKQRKAMVDADVHFVYHTMYDLVEHCVCALLHGVDEESKGR